MVHLSVINDATSWCQTVSEMGMLPGYSPECLNCVSTTMAPKAAKATATIQTQIPMATVAAAAVGGGGAAASWRATRTTRTCAQRNMH